MRTVSDTYKQHIHDPLRNNVYMKINLGLINQDAQKYSYIDSEMNWLSNAAVFDKNKVEIPYATHEHHFFKIDGAMIFPPAENEKPSYFNGIISKNIANASGSMENEYIEISFPQDILPLDIKGLTIQFKFFYPVKFEIEWGGKRHTFDNDSSLFTTDFIFDNITDYLRIIPLKMSSPNCRCRIESIKFGIGLEFSNDDIMESSLETYVHPISNTLSYKNLSFKVVDFVGRYDLENPSSSINFMEMLQDVDVSMGLELPDKTIEWIKMESLRLSEWVSEDNSASFKAKDLLSFNNNQYIRGQYYPSGISLYELAIDVFGDMGMKPDDYYIDGYLRSVTTRNPLPVCLHQEALQIIANAGHSYVSQDSDGKIFILNNFIPEYEITADDKTAYANLQNVKNGTATEYYATFEKGILPVNGSIHNIPVNPPFAAKTGYVSNCLSGANGAYAQPPVIVIQMNARMKTFGLHIKFGLTVCKKFKVQTYLENQLVEVITFENKEKEFLSKREWKEFDRMDIHLLSVMSENQRVYIDYIKFGDVSDYYISNGEFIQKASKGKLNTVIRNFLVGATSYAKVNTEETLVDKDVIYNAGQEEETITFSDPVYGLRCDGAEVLEYGTYYIKIKKPSVKTRTTSHITVFGKKYNVSTTEISYQINEKGVDQSFSNPLIDDVEKAYGLAEWIAEDYLRENKDYSFDWRGDPAVECNDIVYIENAFIPKMQLRIMKNNLTFNGGALRGSIEGRKVVMKK